LKKKKIQTDTLSIFSWDKQQKSESTRLLLLF